MSRWAHTAIWGTRGEGPADVATKTSAFLRLLAEPPIELRTWFVRGHYQGREALWDARGDSGVVERDLERNVQHTDFGQGLAPMTSYASSIIDAEAVRDAEILVQCIVNAPPIKVWFPNRVELSFKEVPDDRLLRAEAATRVVSALARAFAPWWVTFDCDDPRGVDPDDRFHGRPIVGRVTYLSAVYGDPPELASARVTRLPGGVIITTDAEHLSPSEAQEGAVARTRDELRRAGLLLSREECETRRATMPNP